MATKKISLSETEQAQAQRWSHILACRIGPTKACEKLAVAKTTLYRWRMGSAVPSRIKFTRLKELAISMGHGNVSTP